jgi:ApaG protein
MNPMVSLISEGVEVSVETFYQQDYSNPMQSEYMFAYRISIENHNSFPVKLHRRHWYIFDSTGSTGKWKVKVSSAYKRFYLRRKVPVCKWLQPANRNGKNAWHLSMENLNNKKFFDVNIPAFEMFVPFKNN